MMLSAGIILLYVENPINSASFYADLLGRTPMEASPTFAMFGMEHGVKLGLWSRQSVEPKAMSLPGAGEIAFTLPDDDAVRATHADWSRRGLTIAQEPAAMDFGFTFVALDPDGHRLRVFAPAAPGGTAP